jgi:predicted permease
MFGRKRGSDDFAEEIRTHLELEADELKGEGLSEAEAQRRARVAFGSVSAAQERFNLQGRMAWLDSFAQDVRFALRQLRRRPGFAVTAILILALGMGVSVAIFGFTDAALLEPLPYAQPNRLMAVNESSVIAQRWPLSYSDFQDWQRMNRSLSSLDIYSGTTLLLHGAGAPAPVQGERVSGGFFRTLGVRPILGRDFTPGEDRVGGPNVALLSYGAWVERYGARKDIVGQTVDLDNKASVLGYTIIGVLPRTFTFAPSANAEFWIPINSLSHHEYSRTFYEFWGMGRLRDGVTPVSAQGEMTAIAKQLQQQYGITGRNLSASVIPLAEVFVGDVRPILLTLLAGTGMLLLIACVNVASLVLVRSESRRREVAVRGALGATTARLVRQFVTEGLLLAGAGCAGGLLTALGAIKLLEAMVPKDMAANMPFLDDARLNAHTCEFAGAIALLAALLLAATPALRLGFQKIREGLTDGDRGTAGRLWQRLGANLVVVELAVAVVLLAGAGLLGQSLYRLLHVELGFAPDHLATMRVMAPGSAYTSSAQMTELYGEIEQKVAALPGVEAAGMSSMLPVECNCSQDAIHVQGHPDLGEHNEVDERHVSPGYLPALGARLVRGRFFTNDDTAGMPGVAVINETLARKYFPGEDPIGQKFADDEGGMPTVWEVVGVVGDVREGPLDTEIWPAEYFPLSQPLSAYNSFNLAVRTRQDPDAMMPTLVDALHGIDPNLVVRDEATMSAKIDGTQAALLHRLAAWLVGGFAVIALVLGVVGLYGVIAYSVSQRTREIGVRMALGAQRGAVYGMVMGQAGRLTAVGLGFGLVGSVGASLLMRKLLFGVAAWDVPTLAAVAVVLGGAAMAASFLPARRAAGVNPVEALRAE